MDAQQAIGSVAEWIRSRGVDYPTEGLVAERFEAGWSVYAPVDVDDSDPMAFLDMPVGRSVFLVGDSGRIKETSSSVPPRVAEEEFIAEELAARERQFTDQEFMAEFKRAVMDADTGGDISDFTIVDSPAPDEAIAARASELLDPIVQHLAQLGPPGWRRFEAVFSCTVSAEISRLRFWTDHSMDVVEVPDSIVELTRQQRHIAAGMSAGPWWRLLLTVRREQPDSAEVSTNYDYGDEPIPEQDLLAPERYRDDLATYRRAQVPPWLAEYIAGADHSSKAGTPTRTAPDGAGATQPPEPRHDQPTQHAEISTRIKTIGNDEDLGNLWGIYPASLISASRLSGFGIAAGALVLLGIVMLATADALGVVMLAIAGAFAVYVARGVSVNSQHAGTCLGTFESGVVFIDHQGQAHVFRWRTTTVRQRIVNYTRYGSPTRTTYQYQLTGPDGAGLTLRQSSASSGLTNPEKWGREIQEGITHAQLPAALRTVAGGGTVTFGPIQINDRTVAARGTSVPWSAIEQTKVIQGHVSLRVEGRWLSLIHTEISQIPNFFVFHALAEHLRNSAHRS